MGFNSSGGKAAISTLISLAIHGCVFLMLCISFHARTKPLVPHTMKVSVVRREPPKPKVEPPKPKVEPPKPKVEPTKTSPKQPKQQSLAERIKNAESVKTQPAKPQINTNNLKERLNNVFEQEHHQTTPPPQSTEVASAGIVVETANYAEQIVRPYIQQNWIQPVKGELDVANPNPVEIKFTVYASGSIADVRIVKRSNSRVLNASVEQFISGGGLKRLSPLSSIGSNAQSLRIAVSMGLTN